MYYGAWSKRPMSSLIEDNFRPEKYLDRKYPGRKKVSAKIWERKLMDNLDLNEEFWNSKMITYLFEQALITILEMWIQKILLSSSVFGIFLRIKALFWTLCGWGMIEASREQEISLGVELALWGLAKSSLMVLQHTAANVKRLRRFLWRRSSRHLSSNSTTTAY